VISNCRITLCRIASIAVLVLCTACSSSGSGGNASDGDTETGKDHSVPLISNDDTMNPPDTGERELLFSEESATKTTVTQCFCLTRFSNTLEFYHFHEQNVVLLIEFDNQKADFDPTASLALFDSGTTSDAIAKWINNQHSDGLYVDAAEPVKTYALSPDTVSITSTAFLGCLSGDFGDEYEKYMIEFTVSNLSDSGFYFLNGFADQSVVHLQIK